MLHNIITQIEQLIMQYSAYSSIALYVAMTLESAGAPLPSEIILPLAGYLVSRKIMTFATAFWISMLGGASGFLLQYAVGRAGGRIIVERYGRYFFITPEHLRRTDEWFEKYGNIAVLTARLLPIVRGLISLPAGAVAMPIGTFLVYSLIGAAPFTFVFIYGGYILGQNWITIVNYMHYVNYGFIVLVLLAALIVWLRRRLRSDTNR